MNIIKEVLEYIYFLSGPVIAVFAFKALGQIKVTREIAKINSRREAVKLATEECRYYSENIIPLINELEKKIEEFDVQIFSKSKVDVKSDKIDVLPFVDYKNYDESWEKISPYFGRVINSLSHFSTFFVSGVADESVAYNSLGTTYCYIIKRLSPVLVPIIADREENNAITLFYIWNNRKVKAEAIQQKIKLEERIESNHDTTIKPIGT